MLASPFLTMKTNRSPHGSVGALARAAAFLLATCGIAAAATVEVRVDPPGSFHRFVPEVVNINPGDTVRWVWGGGSQAPHTVTSGDPSSGQQDGRFNSPLRTAPFTFSYTFNEAGTVNYFCVPHREMGMYGTVNVGPPSTPTPTPAGSAAQPLNVSTRLRVQSGQNSMIGGFIVTGNAAKRVIVRAIGPSLAGAVAGALADPTVELNGSGGAIAGNDNWKDTQQSDIQATGVAPQNDLESAIVATLSPGNYTAIVQGKNQSTGVGLVEVYDLDQPADSKLANISTRGVVETGSNVMIGGFILGKGSNPGRVIVRALGPTLSNSGVSGVLADPTLELRDGNGALIRGNNNWKDSQQADIQATGIPPQNDLEAAIVETLAPGPYTAIVAGNNGTTGVGLVEVYHLQ